MMGDFCPTSGRFYLKGGILSLIGDWCVRFLRVLLEIDDDLGRIYDTLCANFDKNILKSG